jgi:hypothetical protein
MRGVKAAVMTAPEEGDPLADKYGDLEMVQSKTSGTKTFVRVEELSAAMKGQQVGSRSTTGMSTAWMHSPHSCSGESAVHACAVHACMQAPESHFHRQGHFLVAPPWDRSLCAPTPAHTTLLAAAHHTTGHGTRARSQRARQGKVCIPGAAPAHRDGAGGSARACEGNSGVGEGRHITDTHKHAHGRPSCLPTTLPCPRAWSSMRHRSRASRLLTSPECCPCQRRRSRGARRRRSSCA